MRHRPMRAVWRRLCTTLLGRRGLAITVWATLLILVPAFSSPFSQAPLAQAAGPLDIRGAWDSNTCYARGASYPQQWHITFEDLHSGHFLGYAGNPGAQLDGTVTASGLTVLVTVGSYTSHEASSLTVSGNQIRLSGHFHDSNGTTGTCVGTLTHVRLSGTVETIACGAANGASGDACRKTPRPGVTITISGTESDQTTTGADGSYAFLLARGAYTVTPKQGDAGFDPNEQTVTLQSDLKGVDFTTCASSSGAASGAAQGIAPTSGRRESGLRVRAAAPKATCPPDHIDWEMSGPDTSSVPQLATEATLGILPTKDIYPPLAVKLFLTKNGKPYTACGGGTLWKWKVTAVSPTGATVDKKNTQTQGCPSITAYVSTSGTYRVEANEYAAGKTEPLRTKPVVDEVKPRQVVIAAMGDSNGSGEGLPPFYYTQCNRGVASYQYQAAQLLEKQAKGHAAVTFVSASCSGARTQHLVNTTYAGIRPGTPLPPQINQLETQFAPPSGMTRIKPDATLISIGVNNIAFGPLIEYCIKEENFHHTPCEDQQVSAVPDGTGGVKEFLTYMSEKNPKTLRQALTQLLADLPQRFAELNAALSAHSDLFKPGTVYVNQYPAFWFSHGSSICDLDPFYKSTWQWLADAGANLNTRIAAAAHQYGWKVIVVPESAFYGHGYCMVRGSYFVPLVSGAMLQGNKPGAFHPTKQGARVTAVQAVGLLCPLLKDPKACQTLPTWEESKQ